MISVIIVNYCVKKEVLECIGSVVDSNQKSKYEIIVVDNDEVKTLEGELRKKFPKVKYIPNENRGYGEGNNVGARAAKGEYLYFLNPDTKFLNNAIDVLVDFLDKNKTAGICAPLLFDSKKKVYQLQGVRELTPLRAILALSFVSKLFPKNKVYRDYYLFDWDKKSVKEVDAVPGTAFVIRKNVFEKAGGFDEKFFLFFEEFDLCKRVKELGWKIFIDPAAKVLHYWGESTKQRDDIEKVFLSGRFYYFKKHFGFLKALFVESFLRIDKYSVLLFIVLAIGSFLRLYRIDTTMPFIGDQGWFYLSARDLVVSGQIPLVGIASSHPWLHQGAFWTYLLSIVFWGFGFNPLSGTYLSIFVDVFTIYLLYITAAKLFSRKIGIFSAGFYAVSTLVISNGRMAYHTSPIPFFCILYILLLYGFVKGNKYAFAFIIFILAILYNFEIATFPLWISFMVIIFFGIWKKKSWIQAIKNFKVLFLSLLLWIIAMLPMIAYDFNHNFPQTFGFLLWLVYRFLVIFGFPQLHPEIPNADLKSFINFVVLVGRDFIFSQNLYLSLIIILVSLIIFFVLMMKSFLAKRYEQGMIIVGLVFLVIFAAFFAIRTPSYAYLPMFFPVLVLMIAVSVDKLFGRFSWIVFVLILYANSYYQFLHTKNEKAYYLRQISVAKELIKEADGKEYNIKGEVDNFRYLTWWLGHGESDKAQKLIFYIQETKSGIKIVKEQKI